MHSGPTVCLALPIFTLGAQKRLAACLLPSAKPSQVLQSEASLIARQEAISSKRSSGKPFAR